MAHMVARGNCNVWCGDGAAALLPVIIWATGTVAVVAVVARLLSPQSFRCSRTAAGLLLWFLTFLACCLPAPDKIAV